MSCMNIMNMDGPLTGPKGMTLYVHLMAPGPANANFSLEDFSTLNWWYPWGASKSQKHELVPKARWTAESQRGIGYAAMRVT